MTSWTHASRTPPNYQIYPWEYSHAELATRSPFPPVPRFNSEAPEGRHLNRSNDGRPHRQPLVLLYPTGSMDRRYPRTKLYCQDQLQSLSVTGHDSQVKEFWQSTASSPHTASATLTAIQTVHNQQDPPDYKMFLKMIRSLGLNGIFDLFWKGWLLSDPAFFLHPEPLHHSHRFCWNHNCQWCITVIGHQEIDFRFSLVQTAVGYHAFEDGISLLKKVTGHDHQAVQHYLFSVTAGAVPN